eukprot:7501969-Pyramimonas_sp.AAC.1
MGNNGGVGMAGWKGARRAVGQRRGGGKMEGRRGPEGTVEELLESESARCYQWCSDQRRSKPRLRLARSGINRQSKNVYPELQSQYKAMDVKIYCIWLQRRTIEIWGEDPDDLHAKMVITCVWALTQ